jgi:hypothetical protein
MRYPPVMLILPMSPWRKSSVYIPLSRSGQHLLSSISLFFFCEILSALSHSQPQLAAASISPDLLHRSDPARRLLLFSFIPSDPASAMSTSMHGGDWRVDLELAAWGCSIRRTLSSTSVRWMASSGEACPFRFGLHRIHSVTCLYFWKHE